MYAQNDRQPADGGDCSGLPVDLTLGGLSEIRDLNTEA